MNVYLGHKNSFARALHYGDLMLDAGQMAAITAVEVLYQGVRYSSIDYPEVFDWETRASESVIVFRLGLIPGIPVGRDRKAEIIIYAPDYVEGIVWGDVDIKVIDIDE